jgi:hypothetical protein
MTNNKPVGNFLVENCGGATTLSDIYQVRSEIDAMFPRFLHGYLTWQIGVPTEDEQLSRRSQLYRVVQATTLFCASILAGILALPTLGWLGVAALPFTVSAAVGSARYLQLVVYHHAAHRNLMGPVAARYIGRVIAAILVIKPFDRYAEAHNLHHSPQALSTDAEDTVIYLTKLGIHPGLSRAQINLAFWRALISPVLHVRMLASRFADQLKYGTGCERVALVSYITFVAAAMVYTGWWIPFLVGWALPLTIGYQMAQTARLVVEHRWQKQPPANGALRSLADVEQLTIPIFCAVRPPKKRIARSIAAFYLAMLLNAYVRWIVLPGDSGPSHDMHHDRPSSDWANHISAASAWRQSRLATGTRQVAMPAWGYAEALDICLASFSNAHSSAIIASAKIRNLRALQDLPK